MPASSPPPPPVAIVVARYNATITSVLLDGALSAYAARFPGAPAPHVFDAVGSFEVLPVTAAACASGKWRGVVALGCIIKGETSHDLFLGHAVTSGLADIMLQSGVPIGLGVLTVNTVAQARARAGLGRSPGASNKGAEAMNALLDTLDTLARVRAATPPRARGPKPRAATGRLTLAPSVTNLPPRARVLPDKARPAPRSRRD